MTELIISADRWLELYNVDFTPYLEILSHNNARYVSWTYATMLLKEYCPTLEVGFKYCEDTEQIYHVDKTYLSLIKELLLLHGNTFLQYGDGSANTIIDKGETKKVVDGNESFTMSQKGLASFIETKYTDVFSNIHPYLLPYIYDVETGAKTSTMYFPIMGKGNRSVSGIPDNMTLNKNIQRAVAKIIAYKTGLFYRTWSGEDFDTEKPQLLEAVTACNNAYKAKTGENHKLYSSVHMGLSIDEIKAIGKTIKEETEKLKK